MATVKHALTATAWTQVTTGKTSASADHLSGSTVITVQAAAEPASLDAAPLKYVRAAENAVFFGLGDNIEYIWMRATAEDAEISVTETAEG